jgi:hypothetical protein
MSKTIAEIGLIVGGIGLSIAGIVTENPALIGLGVTTVLGGVGVALRPSNKQVGALGTVSFGNGPSPRRVIYGQFETGGVLTYASFPASQNLSTTNQYLQLVYTLTGHEISSFDAVVIDGNIYNFGNDLIWSPVGDNLWHLYPGSSATYSDFYWQHLFFEFDFGRNNATQPFPVLASVDNSWTSACLQRGCAKVHVICRADSSWTALFPAGQIPNIRFLVTGKKLIDTRIQTAWQPSTGYVQYDYAVDSAGHVWVQTNASGTSGAGPSSPLIYSTSPTTVTDGTLSWTSYGYGMTQISQGTDGAPQGHVVNGRLVNDAWAPGSGYTPGAIIEAPLGYLQLATNSGTTGTSEPTPFATTQGSPTSDNTQSWVCLGRSWHAINPSNSALCVYDYLLDTDAGMGAAASTIDTSSVSSAANVCEDQELIIWNSDNTVVYENLYSCNGMFDHSSVRGNVLTSLCGSMAGWAIPPGDFWHIFAGSYQTPTVSLGDTDMRGPIKGDFRLSRRDVCNSVKGKFVPAFLPSNPAAQATMSQVPGTWQAQSFPAYQANGLAGKPNYLNSEDGGQIIWLDLQLDFTTSLWTAQRLAKIALMRTRFQQTLTLPCKSTALQLEAGDVFGYTHTRWGINGQAFEITQASIVFDGGGSNNDEPMVGVDIVARQTDPSVYEFQGPTSSTVFGEYSPYGITGVMTGVE